MVQQVGGVPIIVPDSIEQIDPIIPEKGNVFTWSWRRAGIAGVAGNGQAIVPVLTFNVPFQCTLTNVKIYVNRSSGGGVFYDQNKFIWDLTTGSQETLINLPISVVTPAQTTQYVGQADTFRGPTSFDCNVFLRPSTLYEIDVSVLEVISAGDIINIDVVLQIEK